MKVEVMQDRILFFEKTKIICVEMKELIAIEGINGEIVVHGRDFRISFRDSAEHILKDMETLLIRCTQRIAVNPKEIRQLKNGEVKMKSGQVFPIARQRNMQVAAAYLTYLGLPAEHWRIRD